MKLSLRRRPPTDPRRERLQERGAAVAAPGSIPPELLDRVRAIEIKARRLVNSLFLGEYHAVFRGRGIEFDELRPYVPGDDVRSLDWKAYARTGQPSIRRYREDRDLTVLFVVDVSASQRAGALPRNKADLAAEVCAVLALAAIRNKDRVGLLLFASKPERYVRPSGGTTHVLRVVREMLWATRPDGYRHRPPRYLPRPEAPRHVISFPTSSPASTPASSAPPPVTMTSSPSAPRPHR